MGVEITTTVYYECDQCGDWDEFSTSEQIDQDEIEERIESEGWEFRNGKLLCPDCVSEDDEDQEIKPFLDRCYECIRKVNRYPEAPYCPLHKNDCDRLAYELGTCGDFLPIGGIKDTGPKYKPVDNCSLDGFLGE